MADAFQAIRFPVAIDASAGRLARETDHDAYVRQLIRQVLLTGQGERINRPDFGASLRRLVFTPSSPATASLAKTVVLQALTLWLGTIITVDDIQAEATGERLDITIVYTVIARGERRALNLEVTV